jgi:hypothetical protein
MLGGSKRALGRIGWIALAIATTPCAAGAETLQTLRCDTNVIMSTGRGYHTAAEGIVLFDVVVADEAGTSFTFRVHPGVYRSIALSLRDCVIGPCTGPMTRDSFTLADRKADGATVRTIDIGRVNGEYFATSETRDAKGGVIEVLTERGRCEKTEPTQKF